MAAIKKKNVSKKNKSSWRKHTNIQDVEDFLDRQRQDERIGTFSEKTDEELFQVDVQVAVKKVLSEKKKRKANAKKPLKTLFALENTSKVKDPIVKRNHVKKKKNGRDKEKEILNPKTQKQIQANKDRMKYYEKLDKKLSKDRTEKDFSTNLWKEEDIRECLTGLTSDWISKSLSQYVLQNTGKACIMVHDGLRHKTTKAKAFDAPHPGTSYNPSLSDHQDLIKKVAEREEKIIKEEKHLKRVTTDMFSKVTPEERDELRLKEMSSGLEEIEEETENEDPTHIKLPYKAVNPPVENKKKSKKIRRKQKEKKILTNTLKKKEQLKKQRVDIHRLAKIKEEVKKEEEALNQLKKQRKLVAKKKKFETKRLGRLKYKEPEMAVSMPNEVTGNLRNVQVKSSILVDRFKNFQKRNMLPATKEIGKRKPRKIKRFPRSSHKKPGASIVRNKK